MRKTRQEDRERTPVFHHIGFTAGIKRPWSVYHTSKIKEINLLPVIRAETVKILKRVDMLGIDPLTALSQAKDKPSSRALGEFLGGYVSAIQSGGNVINYLKSKMSSSYDRLEASENSLWRSSAALSMHGLRCRL